MPPVVVTPPVSEPITLAELKTAAHITHTSEDAFISSTIAAARFRYELDTRRQMMEATYDWFLPCFPSGTRATAFRHLFPEERKFEVPLPPLTSVVSIKYFDTAGVEQTLATSVYGVKTSSEPGRIYLKPNQEWPDLQDDLLEDAVTVRFIAGAATTAAVPDLDKKAITMLAQTWVENRESVVLDDRIRAAEVPMSYNSIAIGREILLVG